MKNIIFGEILKKLRLKKKLRQITLAKRLNISQVIVSLWENGLREPSMSSLIAVADYFNVSVDYLLGRED